MSVLFWTGGTGSQSWATGANWSGGSAPVTGDLVYILSGTSAIDTGLNQSAVTLASLTVGSGFTGSVGVAGDTGAYLQIGVTAFAATAATGGNGVTSGGFSRFKWDAGAVTYTAVVNATGSAADSGRGALQIKGGTASSKLYVTGGSVDVAAKPGETGTLAELAVSGGTVTTGSGLTCPTMTQTAGVLNVGGAVTTLSQYGGTLNTSGTSLLTTVKVNGTANFGHRPTGNAFTNLTIDGDGSADFSADPRTVLFANAPVLYKGATLTAFSPSQLKLTGPASFQFALDECGFEDVTLNLGPDVTVTVA